MSGAVVAALLDAELLTLSRVVGMLRRRDLPITGIAVGPTAAPGMTRVTIMMDTEAAAADRLARQLDKVVGVHGVAAMPVEETVARELALVKVRADAERYAELLDVALLYKATIVDESPEAVVLEIGGSEAFVLSFLRALEPFELLDVARTGAVAVPRAGSQRPHRTLTSEAAP